MSILAGIEIPNPWRGLVVGRPPYVSPADEPILRQHNARYSVDSAYHVHLDSYPEPYIGDPEAPILLLNRNPGWKDFDAKGHAKPQVAQVIADNLRHLSSSFPFYPVGPAYRRHHDSKWWSRSLRHWTDCYGDERVAKAFFCVEYMPYHSRRYKRLRQVQPSQRYSIALVEAKIRAGAIVIVMRGQTDWRNALGGGFVGKYHLVKNHQSGSLWPEGGSRRGNLTKEAGADVDRVLKSMR